MVLGESRPRTRGEQPIGTTTEVQHERAAEVLKKSSPSTRGEQSSYKEREHTICTRREQLGEIAGQVV